MERSQNTGAPKKRTVVLHDEGLRTLGGFVQIPVVVLKHPDISYGAKVAYGVLLSYAWQEDFCWPAQDRMAADLNCTDRWVRKLLTELRQAGMIDWEQQGLNQPNIYHILPLSRWVWRKAFGDADRNDTSGPDRKYHSAPDRNDTSVQDRMDTSAKVDSKKQIQHTPSVGLKASSKSSDATAAASLVEYFHRQAGHTEGRKPTQRELAQAQELLSQVDEERCRYVVDFALESARETNFRMQHLGAVLSYVSGALNAFEGAKQARLRREAEEQKRRDDEKAIADERAEWQGLSPAERVERRLKTALVVFPALHRGQEPTAEDVAALRRKYAQEEGVPGNLPPPHHEHRADSP